MLWKRDSVTSKVITVSLKGKDPFSDLVGTVIFLGTYTAQCIENLASCTKVTVDIAMSLTVMAKMLDQ